MPSPRCTPEPPAKRPRADAATASPTSADQRAKADHGQVVAPGEVEPSVPPPARSASKSHLAPVDPAVVRAVTNSIREQRRRLERASTSAAYALARDEINALASIAEQYVRQQVLFCFSLFVRDECQETILHDFVKDTGAQRHEYEECVGVIEATMAKLTRTLSAPKPGDDADNQTTATDTLDCRNRRN